MARLWSSGFELNSTTANVEWTATSGTPVIQSSVARTGTYAMRITSMTSATARYLSYQYRSAEGAGNYYFRFYFRADTLPSAANRIALWNDATTLASPQVYLTLDNSGVLRLYDEDGQITGTTTLSTSTWYNIEVHINTSPAAGSHVVEARVDEAAAFASSSARRIATTNNLLSMTLGGNLASEAQTQADWYFDDVAINDTTGSFQNSWPGAGGIVHLRPNAAGDASDWTNSYTNVDEVTPDNGTTLVASNTLNQIDDHNIDATPASVTTNATINCVQVGVRFNGAGASANASFVLRIKSASGETVEESAAITPASTTYVTNASAAPRNYSLTLYDLPGASTTAWTKADLDTTQIGYRLSTASTNNAQISTVWLLVDSKPGSSVSPSISPSVSESPSVSPSASESPSVSPSVSASPSAAPSDTPFTNSTNSGSELNDVTSHTVTLPPTVNQGELLIVWMSFDGTPNVTWDNTSFGNWTEIVNTNNVAVKLVVYAKVAGGNESGGVLTISTNSAEQSVYRSESIDNWEGTLEDGVNSPNVATGSSVNPNPPTASDTWGTYHRKTIAIETHDTTSAVTSFPSRYFYNQFTGQSSVSGGTTLSSSGFNDTVGSENPSTFTISDSNRWIAATISVQGPSLNNVTNWPPVTAPTWGPPEVPANYAVSDIRTLLSDLAEMGFTQSAPTSQENINFFNDARCDENHRVVGRILISPNSVRFPFAVCNNSNHRQFLVLWPEYRMGGGSGTE